MEHVRVLLTKTLESLGVEPFSIEEETVAGTHFFSVTSSFDIAGAQGDRIRPLNNVVKRLAEKQGLDVRFTIDGNGFYKAEVVQIEKMAHEAAQAVLESKGEKELTPMRAFERLVVHAALTGMEHIKTESIGEGRDRKVVVKYV
jgi:spoIIIJ-associated protein